MNNTINHIAIIMDGNQRWSQINNKTVSQGYLSGLDNLNKIINECINAKIKNLTVFALSSENINRPSASIIYKMIKETYNSIIKQFKEKKISVKIVGEKNHIPLDIQNILSTESLKTKDPDLCLNVAFNYGSQYEIVNIVKEIIIKNDVDNIDYKKIRSYMYLGNISDPEILIRTGGYKRLSNFMMLNLSYTELFFTETLWPNFSTSEFNNILNKFKTIKRNYGL